MHWRDYRGLGKKGKLGKLTAPPDREKKRKKFIQFPIRKNLGGKIHEEKWIGRAISVYLTNRALSKKGSGGKHGRCFKNCKGNASKESVQKKGIVKRRGDAVLGEGGGEIS